MRFAFLPFALCFWLWPEPVAQEPFVAVGIWYAGPSVQPPAAGTGDVETLRRDLTRIRRAGFNAVTTWITWRDGEPKAGGYALAAAERLIAAAAEADLKVLPVVFTEPAPAWASAEAGAGDRFLAYVSKRLSLQPGVVRVREHTPVMDDGPGRIQVAAGSVLDARLAMWSAIARGAREVAFLGAGNTVGPAVLALGETAGVITRNQALFAPLRLRTGGVSGVTAGGGAPVDVRMLESDDALMIIGMNYAAAPRKATITFAADIPEAIWQNMETGTSVNFVMGQGGPFLEHTFAPRDALVLMIRKRPR